MNNLTLAQKQQLETKAKAGKKIVTVAYDPVTVVGNPEASAVGLIEFYRETSTNLVEVIFTS